MCIGAQMNSLTEMVLLSTYNICFGLEMRKIILVMLTCLGVWTDAAKLAENLECI